MLKLRSSIPTGAGPLGRLAAGAALFLGACSPIAYLQVLAQVYVSASPPAPAYYPEGPAPQIVANPLDQLMAPIALYPDPLISLILPAATFPSDIAAAGAYLGQGGDPAQVDAQPWDPSVRSLAHYPSVVTWMAQNEPWTQTVGSEFVSQPAQVMTAIQRLRELARAAGTLADSRQQRVIVDGNFVEIEPAQPGVIYVPRYDPAVVFVDQPYYGFNGPFLTFGPAYNAGAWLTFGCNWGGGGIMIVDANYWHGGGGWWHPYGPGPGGGEFSASANFRAWSYPASRPRPQAIAGWQSRSQSIQPHLVAGSPAQPPKSAFRNIRTRGPAAVAAVARNPAAFKGKPINNAIIAKSSNTPVQKGAPGNQSAAARPQAVAAPKPQAAAVLKPAAVPQKAAEPVRSGNSVNASASTAPANRDEEGRKKGPEAKPADGKQTDKKETKQPEKNARPAPKDEKPKDEKPKDPTPSQ
ncbi:MAG: DUF3300 domain-containing protein [Opitutaceae bacterium]